MKIDGYIGSAKCENENCKKEFNLSKPVYRHVNAGATGTVIDDFENYRFNRVKCKYCGTEFTYEMPTVVYNLQKKYFVFAGMPENSMREDRLPRLLEILNVKDTKIYYVPYQAFAVEIEKAYKYNIDYNTIYRIKKEQLGADKLDIIKEYIIFSKYENGILYYHHLNYLNEIQKTYEIKYDNEE